MSQALKLLLLALVICALVTHVRGHKNTDEDIEVQDEETTTTTHHKKTAKTSGKATSTVKATSATTSSSSGSTKAAASGSGSEDKKQPPAGTTNASPARLYLHSAIRDYVTLSARFATLKEECRQVYSASGLPNDIVGMHVLLMNAPDDKALLEVHNKLKDLSNKLAKEIKCEDEANIFWQHADILVGAIVNAHRDIIREVDSNNLQQKHADELKKANDTTNHGEL